MNIIKFLVILVFNLAAFSAFAQTYYVRPDGGTAQQCNGLYDAPYPGSGENQNCAWSHPFWALDEYGNWKIQGGDTIIIRSGSYVIGYKAPNTGWCSEEMAYSCVLPPLPSGPDADHPTRILGYGWDQGCKNPPELWGTGRVYQVLDLTGTSNAVVACLEITDHEGCVEFHDQNYGSSPYTCNRDNSPYGDWAEIGIRASDSSDVVLRNLNIHGLASDGIVAVRLNNWTLENVRLAGNGWSGWNGDLGGGEDYSNSGNMVFRNFIVEWNGCVETYPDEDYTACWAQSHGGYGDGVGVARSGGHWIIEDSIFRYNTSDGLDLLYVGVDHPDSMVEVRRVKAYGNAGNQLKIGGTSIIENVVVVGNCNFFTGKSFAQYMEDYSAGDACRSGGGAVAISLGRGDSSYIINSSIASHGWADVEVYCNTKDFPDQPACTGEERLYMYNDIFMGYRVAYITEEENLADLVGEGGQGGITADNIEMDYCVVYNVDEGILNELGPQIGSHSVMSDPRFVNEDIDNFDAHLQSGSPAIDAGLPVGSNIGPSGSIPAEDVDKGVRPYGSGVDIGAYEFGTVHVPNFSDVHEDDWFYTYVIEAARLGLFKGYPDGTFKPQNNITRGETATVLARLFGLPVGDCTEEPYPDVSVDAWYCPYIKAIKEVGISDILEGSNFRPDEAAMRWEVIVMLENGIAIKQGKPLPSEISCTEEPFTDVTLGDSYCSAVSIAKDQGVTNGYPDGTFRPYNNITRAEIAAMMVRVVDNVSW